MSFPVVGDLGNVEVNYAKVDIVHTVLTTPFGKSLDDLDDRVRGVRDEKTLHFFAGPFPK